MADGWVSFNHRFLVRRMLFLPPDLVEHLVNGKWVHDTTVDEQFKNRLQKSQLPQPRSPLRLPPATLESTVRFLKNVCAVVLTHDAITEHEVEAVETAMQDIQAQIKTFREMASRAKVEAGKK